MLLENNISSLVKQLSALGLTNSESRLRKNICLHPAVFQIQYRYIKAFDVMTAIFFFAIVDGEYKCLHYDASLRKEINAPEVVLNDVNVPGLDEKMNLVKWDSGLTDFIELNDGFAYYTWELEETIEEVMLSLEQLSSTPEGKATAEILKFKYWSNTILSSRIADISILKEQYELTERFYLIDEAQQITIEEAYRFLCNRWREKQVRTKRKRQANAKTIFSKAATTETPKPVRKINKEKK